MCDTYTDHYSRHYQQGSCQQFHNSDYQYQIDSECFHGNSHRTDQEVGQVHISDHYRSVGQWSAGD